MSKTHTISIILVSWRLTILFDFSAKLSSKAAAATRGTRNTDTIDDVHLQVSYVCVYVHVEMYLKVEFVNNNIFIMIIIIWLWKILHLLFESTVC